MGATSSQSLLEEQLIGLLRRQGTIIKSKTAKDFVQILQNASPWFLVSGGFNIPDWEQVKVDLQKYLHKEGHDSVSLATFSLWRLVKDALLSDDIEVQEHLNEAKTVLEESQIEEALRTLQTSDVSDSAESSSDSAESSLEGDDVEVRSEKDARCLRGKSQISRKDRPPTYNPDFCNTEVLPSAPMEGLTGGVAYPVIETQNAQGQRQREHNPLDFKSIKQLKEAVMSYGPHAPFTIAILESFSASNCTPSDWMQLCRAALSGGDYLIWRSEFQEHCQTTANRNAAAGFPARNLEMLTGSGQYATLQAQILYDPAVYAQISVAATRAWKGLPNKAAGEQLSKVIQGPSEPFAEFVDRLLQLAGRVFGDVDQAMPIVKQLAFENANKYCKEAIRPHKNKSLNDYLKLCRDIDGHHIMGQVMASAMRGINSGGNRPKTCFGCGQQGHVKKNCPGAQATAKTPGLCPRCKKGHHWSNECRSKADAQGNRLPPSGNGQRGPLRTPQSQVYGALDTPVPSPVSHHPIQFVPRRNPFLSKTLSEAPLEAQDWTSAPPPEQY